MEIFKSAKIFHALSDLKRQDIEMDILYSCSMASPGLDPCCVDKNVHSYPSKAACAVGPISCNQSHDNVLVQNHSLLGHQPELEQ
jgi:hypothetical protein